MITKIFMDTLKIDEYAARRSAAAVILGIVPVWILLRILGVIAIAIEAIL